LLNLVIGGAALPSRLGGTVLAQGLGTFANRAADVLRLNDSLSFVKAQNDKMEFLLVVRVV